MNIEIANRLMNLRKKHGYSQEELAEKIGISRQAVSKWERAESSPDTDNLIALSRIYRVSLDELLQAETQNGDVQTTQYVAPQAAGNTTDRRRNLLLYIPYPIICTIAFFIIGYFFGHWSYAWLVYLTIPIDHGLVQFFRKD